MAVNSSTTAEVFEAYLQHFLTPELEEGQVMVMDNLPAHKPERVRELIEERLRAVVRARLLPRLQPHRRSVLQDQEAFGRDLRSKRRDSGGSYGRSTIRGWLPGDLGLIRTRQPPSTSRLL
jgi:DDE superfamily endonuclease